MPEFPKNRLRLRILTVMILIALAAGILGLVASSRREAERQRRIALFASDLERQVARLKWAEDMHRKGYVSKASLIADRMRRDEIEKDLKELGVNKP